MFTRESTEVPICTVDLPAVDKGSEAFMCVHRIYKHGPNVQVGRLFAAFICAIQARVFFFLNLFLRRAKHITGQLRMRWQTELEMILWSLLRLV